MPAAASSRLTSSSFSRCPRRWPAAWRRSPGTGQRRLASSAHLVTHPVHRVLIVEDDFAVAQMYKLKLELDGYLVGTAVDGETGLSMAEKFAPDLILLDIGLP